MAVITETHVRIRLEIALDDAGNPRCWANAESFNDLDQLVRSSRREITDLTAGQKTGMAALLDDTEAKVKAAWDIP